MNLTKQIEFRQFNKYIVKFKEIEEKHVWINWVAAPIVTIAIFLVVYAIKGVYPFGGNTVSYYDMSGSSIPIYTFFWDVLHGKSGLYLNWYSGLGVSMADVVGAFLFFPTNLFFLFTSRDGIIYAMSFFVMYKMAICAFAMSFYYSKHYKDFTGALCSGLLYAFCGFAIQYYTNIFYFDLVILFPFIVWSFEELLLKHKFKLFTILMFFAFFTNVQLVFMVGIYLLLKGYFLLKRVDESERSKSILLFAMSIIIALLLASFVLVPSISQTIQSTRSEENSGFDYINVMKSVYCKFRMQKYFMLYGSEIAVGLIILVFLRGKEIIRKYIENLV
ncbi:MAG: YfhO family protein, partial [Eubacterium sp.]|nr:YfhO family protein [Eubacterium sp.]